MIYKEEKLRLTVKRMFTLGVNIKKEVLQKEPLLYINY
jgi:hypothetical protein